jgi:GNAT superfamily N-acetyltransferase
VTTFTVVAAREVGGAARLESLALAVFGPGDRPAGWFARKLRRECVDEDLSSVAVATGVDPATPRAWLGYVLVGAPPSASPTVRTAGTGVRPNARGRGIGTALLARVRAAAAERGAGPIELFADPPTLPFYRAFGFVPVASLVTLRGHGQGRDQARRAPAGAAAWSSVSGARSICAWTPEAWAASEGRAAIADAHGRVQALVSREGTAFLVQRWSTGQATPLHDAVRELADALPEGAPWLVPWLGDVSPVTAELCAAGLQPAQRAVALHLYPESPPERDASNEPA